MVPLTPRERIGINVGMKTLPCCGELELFGHATTCVNRPKAPAPQAKKIRTVRLSKSPTACIYCSSETRNGSVNLGDGQFAHKKCQQQACEDDNFSDKVSK